MQSRRKAGKWKNIRAPHGRSAACIIAATAAVVLAVSTKAKAGNTWTGGGSSTNWSDYNNWGGNAPAYGQLTFSSGGTQGTTSVNDSITAQNELLWTGTSSWTINASSTPTLLSLYDNGGAQAKIENQSTGSVTINTPITFAANNGSPPNPFGEINAVNGALTFGSSGTLTVNGSSVYGVKMYGNNGANSFAVNFNDTVSASGKWFGMTANSDIVNINGSFTSGDIYVMNGGTLNVSSGASVTTTAVRLGGDFGTTGAENLGLGAALDFTTAGGGASFSNIINTVSGNTSGALLINSQNTSGTNTISGNIYLDAPLTIQQAAGGTLALTNSTFDLKNQALTFSGASTGSITVAGVLQNSTGAGGIVVNGPAVTLTNANTYAGGTTISSGALVANGARGLSGSTLVSSSTGTGSVTISTNGTLAGTGGAGNVTVNGTITAGSGATSSSTIGTLNTGTQTWNSGGTYVEKFASSNGTSVSNSDELIMSGLTIGATSGSKFTVSVLGLSSNTALTLPVGNSIILADDTSGTSSTFNLSDLSLSTSGISAPAGDSLLLATQSDGSGGYDLVVEAAPEPTSTLLFGIVATPLMLARRRRIARLANLT